MMKPLLVLFFSLMLNTSVFAQTETTQPDLTKAIELREAHKEDEALELFKKVLETDTSNFEALWSASLLYSRVGRRLKDKDNQIIYYKQAKTLAEKALNIDSKHYMSNYAMAVAMGRMALISGAKERVAASKDIKRYGDAALAANPDYAGAWHIIGRWHHKVANLSFIERMAANALFGGAPEGASNEEAIRYLDKAVELRPEYIPYLKDYAIVLADLDQKKKAKEIIDRVLAAPILTPDDAEYKEEMKKLRKDL